jgi:hypothetical protein
VSGPDGLSPVPWTEKIIESTPFSTDRVVIAAAQTWLDGQISEFYLNGLQKLEQRTESLFSFRGSVLNKSRVWSR